MISAKKYTTPATPMRSKPKSSLIARRNHLYGFLFLLPALIILTVFYLYPLVKTVYLSTTDWGLLNAPKPVGLANYQEILGSSEFFRSLGITLYYVFGTSLATIPLAFLIALMLNRLVRFEKFFKSIFFTPVVLSTVISSVLWISVFHPYGGVLQLVRLPFGLSTQNWYQSPTLVVPGLIVFSVWKGLGLYIIIFLAALKNLPESYFDAARVDGASAWQMLLRITIPLLKPIFLFAVVISIVYGFQNFAIVYTSTKGGPGDYSQILPILIYEYGFKFFRMGYASALAVMMFVIMFAFSLIQFRFFRAEME